MAKDDFQDRVGEWMVPCFGPDIPFDTLERCDRFLEESLELIQSIHPEYGPTRVTRLGEYTFGRDVGQPAQELGGVMVTLAALANATGLHMRNAADVELARCWRNIDKIRDKQAAKAAAGIAGPEPVRMEHAPVFEIAHPIISHLHTLCDELESGTFYNDYDESCRLLGVLQEFLGRRKIYAGAPPQPAPPPRPNGGPPPPQPMTDRVIAEILRSNGFPTIADRFDDLLSLSIQPPPPLSPTVTATQAAARMRNEAMSVVQRHAVAPGPNVDWDQILFDIAAIDVATVMADPYVAPKKWVDVQGPPRKGRALIRCMGGIGCNHRPGTCTATVGED